jgi:predicted RND superfamily exporter protein
LAVTLGKRSRDRQALPRSCITIVIGLGLTKLQFATGQDSYLNAEDQIAIDNEAYQDLFGGQIMITLLTSTRDRRGRSSLTGDNGDAILAVTEELESRREHQGGRLAADGGRVLQQPDPALLRSRPR